MELSELIEIVNKGFLQILEHLRDTTASGGFRPIAASVTDEPLELQLGKWISLTLHNDGGSAVYPYFIRTKPTTRDAPLNNGETLKISQGRKRKQNLYLCCAAGGTASVRLWVLY